MSWFVDGGWEFWVFTLGIAFSFAIIMVLSRINQGRVENNEYQESQKLLPKRRTRLLEKCQTKYPFLRCDKGDFLSNEAAREPRTTKKEQVKIDEQKDC